MSPKSLSSTLSEAPAAPQLELDAGVGEGLDQRDDAPPWLDEKPPRPDDPPAWLEE